MSFRKNLARGRSHIILVIVMLIAGTLIVRIEDKTLRQEVGKAPPGHSLSSEVDRAKAG